MSPMVPQICMEYAHLLLQFPENRVYRLCHHTQVSIFQNGNVFFSTGDWAQGFSVFYHFTIERYHQLFKNGSFSLG